MKVLQVSKLYAPDLGGVETVVKHYAEELARRGHDVTVLCASGKASLRTETSTLNGVRVIRCASLGAFLSMPCSLSLPLRLLRIAGSFDLIHFHEPFPLASACAPLLPKKGERRFKLLVTWHADIVRQKLFKPFAEAFQKTLLRRCDAILATSEAMAASSCVLPEFKDKISTIPLSISLEDYSQTPLPPPAACPERYILSLGRLAGYKGIPCLLEAFARAKLPEGVKLLIAGAGALASFISERIAEDGLKDRVVFINRKLSEEEKKALLQRCLFFVFPSNMKTEAFGITQLEAMAYGKAIVNARIPTGVPWVSVHGVSGLTVEPDSPEELRKALEDLTWNDAKREELGKGGAARLKELFLDSKALAKYAAIVEGRHDGQSSGAAR